MIWTAVLRLLGQDSGGPRAVLDQSATRIKAAISPGPARKSRSSKPGEIPRLSVTRIRSRRRARRGISLAGARPPRWPSERR